jgi:PAS domain-containing protein
MRQALTKSMRGWSRIGAANRYRIVYHGTALGTVAVVALVRWLLGVPDSSAPFLLFLGAIAYSTSVGGTVAAITAILASVLAARTMFFAPWELCAFFAAEAAFIAAVVVRLSQTVQQYHDWLETADASLSSVKTAERRGRVVAAAFAHLQGASQERVVVTLDRDGRIADWGEAATRLYQVGGDRVIGSSGVELFGPAANAAAFATVLSEARQGRTARSRGRHVRADGTPFDVDVELHALPALAGDGFTLLIHDLSNIQASELAARQAAERQRALREDIDLAQRQLSSMRSVTDQYLDTIPSVEGVAGLLERLRTEVAADGIAIVRSRGFNSAVFSAPEGLQPDPGRVHRDDLAQRGLRTHLIHNDPARVSEMTTVGWPEEVGSLIAVPIVRAGEAEGMIEVAYRRGCRSTEWEIALIQMVAVRAVSLLQQTTDAKAGALA